jgi:hypothetical protein
VNDVTQEASRTFTVPAEGGGGGGTNSFTAFSILPVDYAADAFNLTWSGTFPAGCLFRIWYRSKDPVGSGSWSDWQNSATATDPTRAFLHFVLHDLRESAAAGGTRQVGYEFYIDVELGETILFRSKSKSFTVWSA